MDNVILCVHRFFRSDIEHRINSVDIHKAGKPEIPSLGRIGIYHNTGDITVSRFDVAFIIKFQVSLRLDF